MTAPVPYSRAPSAVSRAFGRVIARRRRQVGLSQSALAKAAYLHTTYVGLLERGSRSPKLETLVWLARALDTTPGSLIDELVADLTDYGSTGPKRQLELPSRRCGRTGTPE